MLQPGEFKDAVFWGVLLSGQTVGVYIKQTSSVGITPCVCVLGFMG